MSNCFPKTSRYNFLFDRYPSLKKVLPVVDLGLYPTPVDSLANLSRHFGHDIRIKRDDLTSSIYGGNKVRKLEFLLGDVLSRGYENVRTLGGIGSHHLLATARFASSVGLQVWAVTFPQPMTTHTLAVKNAIAEENIRLFPARSLMDVPRSFCKMLTASTREQKKLYPIPAGGSSSLGVLGYVSAALELAEQIKRGETIKPDIIVVPLGSCGTAAGLLLGLKIAGLPCTIHGVRVTSSIVANSFNVYRLAWDAARLLNRLGVPAISALSRPLGKTCVKLRISGEQLGGGYGHITRGAQEAQRLSADLEGLTLDPTYTSKAMAHIISECKRLNSRKQKKKYKFLFWYTLSSMKRTRECS